jgi:histidinol-phosphate aminotransferase
VPSGPHVPDHILGLVPYKPGRPIEEVERELGLSGVIKLASNENPLGPSPAALRAIAEALPRIHRYPEGGAFELTLKLAARLSVAPEQIVFGNGSNELIELLVRTFVAAGDEVVMSSDAFLIYDLVTRAAGGRSVRIPAKAHHHDLAAMARAIGPRTRVVFIASPNNPTGTIVTRQEWRTFLASVRSDVVVAVDQAYLEYVDDADYADALADLPSHPGIVVMRTFSKIYGLAGLRIGYGVASKEVSDALARVRQPFSVNLLAQVAALAALDDRAHVERSRDLVRRARERYARGLDALGLEYVSSQANFVLVRVGAGARVSEAMLERGVIVRPMDAYGMPEMIRITFGTPEEDTRCLAALAEGISGSRKRE